MPNSLSTLLACGRIWTTCSALGGCQPGRGTGLWRHLAGQSRCGLSRVTLIKGVEELQAAPLAPGRIRREGGDDTH